MGKASRKMKNLPMTLILLVILAVAGYYFYNGGAFPSLSVGDTGFSTLSVQRVDFISNSPEVGGSAYLVVLVANGQGESLSTTLTPDLVRQFTGNQTISGDVKITVNLQNQTCNYPINLSNAYVWKANPTVLRGCSGVSSPIWEANTHYCGGGCGVISSYVSGYAVTRQDVAQIATVSSATVYDYLVNVTVKKADGTSYSAYLNPNVLASDIGSAGRIKWIGSLTGSQSCPTPASDTVLFRDIMTGKYSAHSSAYYGSYLVQSASLVSQLDALKGLQSYSGSCGGYYYPNAQDPSPLTNSYNSLVDMFIASTPIMSPVCSIYSVSSNLQYICTPTQPAIYPTMQLILKASEVGIVVPVGKPQITSIPVTTLLEGGLFKQPVNVKNIGGSQGTFALKLDCPGGTPTFRADIATLQAGEVKQMMLEITSTNAISKVCTFTVYDINDPTNFASTDAQVVIAKQPCNFECCNGTSYQDKPCPPTKEITTLTSVYDPTYFEVEYFGANTSHGTSWYAQMCATLQSGCWKWVNNTKTYTQYCEMVTCKTGTLVDEDTVITPMTYIPQNGSVTIIEDGVTQPPIHTGSFDIMSYLSGIWTWFLGLFR